MSQGQPWRQEEGMGRRAEGSDWLLAISHWSLFRRWGRIPTATSALTTRAPNCGSSSNCVATERCAMLRTLAFPRPAFMKQPAARRIRPIPSHRLQGSAANESNPAPKSPLMRTGQAVARQAWLKSRLPKDFVRHPIANTGKSVLQQQRRLHRQLAMSSQKVVHEVQRKLVGN